MKRTILNIAATVTAVLLVTSLQGQKSKTTPLGGEDVDGRQVQSLMVDAFEGEVWESSVLPLAPLGTVEVKSVPDGNSRAKRCVPRQKEYDERNKKCMGVRFNFVYPGNNIVNLIPKTKIKQPTGVLDGNNKEVVTEVQGVRLPGKVQALSVWVLGRGNEYTLEGWVEDWRGNTHVIPFGDLEFIGWRPMTGFIPSGIPQDVGSYPNTKNLIFKKFVIRSKPRASQERVVMFFDGFKVLTDMYDVFFDGATIDFDKEDKEEKEAIRTYKEQLNAAHGSGGKQGGDKR